jgi:hypothetical protein
MALTLQRFLKIIQYLSSYYNNFKFDIYEEDEFGNKTPSHQAEVWFDVFKDFNELELVEAIKRYCKENIYAPQSPTHILEFIRKKMLENSPSAESVFNEIVERFRNHYYYDKKVVEMYEQEGNHLIAKIISDLKQDFRLWYNGSEEQLTWLKKVFITHYERELEKTVRDTVSQGQIENKGVKLLK